ISRSRSSQRRQASSRVSLLATTLPLARWTRQLPSAFCCTVSGNTAGHASTEGRWAYEIAFIDQCAPVRGGCADVIDIVDFRHYLREHQKDREITRWH